MDPLTPSFVDWQEAMGDEANDNVGLEYKAVRYAIVRILIVGNITYFRLIQELETRSGQRKRAHFILQLIKSAAVTYCTLNTSPEPRRLDRLCELFYMPKFIHTRFWLPKPRFLVVSDLHPLRCGPGSYDYDCQ